MNQIVVQVDCPEVVGHESARDAIHWAKVMNASPQLDDLRNSIVSRRLSGYWWTGDRCQLKFGNESICLKTELCHLRLEKSKANSGCNAADDMSETQFKLQFVKIQLETDWCPSAMFDAVLSRKLVQFDKSDFGYVLKFEGRVPILFSVLKVVASTAPLPESMIYIAPFE